jgi:hypothetical protein
MRTGSRTEETPVRSHRIQIDAVPGKQFAHVAAINYGKRIQAVDAGDDAFGFDVGEAARRNCVLVVAVSVRNSGTGAFHIAHG